MITAQEAERLLKKVFPGVDYSTGWIPKKTQIGEVSPEECQEYLELFPQGEWVDNVNECEDIALGFKIDVHRHTCSRYSKHGYIYHER